MDNHEWTIKNEQSIVTQCNTNPKQQQQRKIEKTQHNKSLTNNTIPESKCSRNV